MTGCYGCISTWPTPRAAVADLRQLPGSGRRARCCCRGHYQQLHTVDDCVYGVISDLLRDVGEATEDTGYLRFVMTERILVSGRHHALCAVDATPRAGGRPQN